MPQPSATVHARMNDAIRSNDLDALRRLAQEHPTWPHDPQDGDPDDPVMAVLKAGATRTDPTLPANPQATRDAMVQALFDPVAPGPCRSGTIALCAAARCGWLPLLDRVLPFSDPNAMPFGITALRLAVDAEQLEVIRRLGPLSDPHRSPSYENGVSALMAAAERNKLTVVDALLASCPTLDLDQADPSGNTALHRTILAEHETMALRLLQAGAHPDRPNRSGQTALMLAIEQDLPDVVQRLLDDHEHAQLSASQLHLDRDLLFPSRSLNLLQRDGVNRSALDYATDVHHPEQPRLRRLHHDQEHLALRVAAQPTPPLTPPDPVGAHHPDRPANGSDLPPRARPRL